MSVPSTELRMEDEPGYRPPAARLARVAILSFLLHMAFIIVFSASSFVASLPITSQNEYLGPNGLLVLGLWTIGVIGEFAELALLAWLAFVRRQPRTAIGIVIGLAAAIIDALAFQYVAAWMARLAHL